MNRKIVYCLPSLYVAGGMERVLTVKANYFADVLGYDIYIILTDGRDKEPFYPLSPKIHVINLGIDFNEMWNKPFSQKVLLYLRKQKEYKAKLTKCLFDLKPDITVSMLRREINFINDIKDGSIKIGELHVNRENYRNFEEGDSSLLKRVFAKWWMWQLIKNTKKLTKFIVLSNEDKEKWVELTNVEVIYNPLPFSTDQTSACSERQVIAVGRYVYQKGYDLLVEAWKKVSEKYPDWNLTIYGAGEHEELTVQVRRLQIENSCHLEKAVPNIIDKYSESSIFVLSSRFEGFGMVIIEAMACGVPAVSFACPCGPKDIIHDGLDGLLVENGNTDELAEKIGYLIEEDDVRREMGHRAKMNSERFKIEEVAQQWVRLFDNLLKTKNK